MRRKYSSSALLLLMLPCLPNVANGYVLPAESILASAAYKRSRLAFATAVAAGTVERDGRREPLREIIRAGKAHRIEIGEEGSGTAVVTTDKKRWRIEGGQPAAPERIKTDFYLTFLARAEKDGGGKRGLLFLKLNKIDETVVSLDRLDRRPVYVIGAKPWEEDKPQIWFDKELLVPVRLITKAEDGALVDVQLTGYGSGVTREWFPHRVKTFRNGALVETKIYDKVELNVEVDDAKFDPPG